MRNCRMINVKMSDCRTERIRVYHSTKSLFIMLSVFIAISIVFLVMISYSEQKTRYIDSVIAGEATINISLKELKQSLFCPLTCDAGKLTYISALKSVHDLQYKGSITYDSAQKYFIRRYKSGGRNGGGLFSQIYMDNLPL